VQNYSKFRNPANIRLTNNKKALPGIPPDRAATKIHAKQQKTIMTCLSVGKVTISS
jgi:hypothetical protein